MYKEKEIRQARFTRTSGQERDAMARKSRRLYWDVEESGRSDKGSYWEPENKGTRVAPLRVERRAVTSHPTHQAEDGAAIQDLSYSGAREVRGQKSCGGAGEKVQWGACIYRGEKEWE